MKLTNNLSFESFIRSCEEKYAHKYDFLQMRELKKGYERSVNISLYANPKFDYMQMAYIRLGLENGVDISKYASVKYSNFLMEVIYHLLKNGAHFDEYILEDCLDTSKLIAAYDVLCRYKGLMRLDEWATHKIYEESPYYVNSKGEPIDEIEE